jgi:hypothetical protein
MMAEVSREARLDGEWSTLKWPTHGKLRVSSVRSAMSIAKGAARKLSSVRSGM